MLVSLLLGPLPFLLERVSSQRLCLSCHPGLSISLSNPCARDKENTRKGLAIPQPCQEAGLSLSGPDLAIFPPKGLRGHSQGQCHAQRPTSLGTVMRVEGTTDPSSVSRPPQSAVTGAAYSNPWSLSLCGQHGCAGLLRTRMNDFPLTAQWYQLSSRGFPPTSSHLFLKV